MQKNILPVYLSAVIFILFIGCEAPEHVDRVDIELDDLTGLQVAFLVGEGFHDGETFIPMGYLSAQGARVVVIGAEHGVVGSYNSDFTVEIQRTVDEVSPDDFDALVIPGGESPAWLRGHDNVIAFAREFFEQQGITAAICHGPQVLITAGVMSGRSATGVEGIKDELEEGGASFYDEPVVRDENLITSRIPDDLYHFSTTIEEAMLEATGRL